MNSLRLSDSIHAVEAAAANLYGEDVWAFITGPEVKQRFRKMAHDALRAAENAAGWADAHGPREARDWGVQRNAAVDAQYRADMDAITEAERAARRDGDA